MIYSEDHATEKNKKASTNVAEEIERTKVNNEVQKENLNITYVRDDVDDNVFLTCSTSKNFK